MEALWGYLEYDGGVVREWYEVTGGDALYCGERIVEVKGAHRGFSGNCVLLEGERNEVKAVSDWLGDRPPFSYRLPAPQPDPYRAVELTLIIDSDPHTELYGAPYRKSIVVSSTRRSVLEGRSPPQLLVVRGRRGLRVVGEDIVEGSSRELALYAYPILGPNEVLSLAKWCEAEQGYGVDKWGVCLEKAASYYRSWSAVRDFMVSTGVEEVEEPSLVAYLARKWAPMAASVTMDVTGYVANAVSKGVYTLHSILHVARRVGGLVVEPRMPVRLRLAAEHESGRVVYETLVASRTVVEGEWLAYAYLCRECWEPL